MAYLKAATISKVIGFDKTARAAQPHLRHIFLSENALRHHAH